MSDELRDRVARDDATYMAMKRKILSLIVDTWDGERLIDNAADAAMALVRAETLEEAAVVADTCEDSHWGPTIGRRIRAMKGKP